MQADHKKCKGKRCYYYISRVHRATGDELRGSCMLISEIVAEAEREPQECILEEYNARLSLA